MYSEKALRNPTGYTYATSALIEIPRSKVQLINPPPKYFPLEPLTWNFTSSIHVDPEELFLLTHEYSSFLASSLMVENQQYWQSHQITSSLTWRGNQSPLSFNITLMPRTRRMLQLHPLFSISTLEMRLPPSFIPLHQLPQLQHQFQLPQHMLLHLHLHLWPLLLTFLSSFLLFAMQVLTFCLMSFVLFMSWRCHPQALQRKLLQEIKHFTLCYYPGVEGHGFHLGEIAALHIAGLRWVGWEVFNLNPCISKKMHIGCMMQGSTVVHSPNQLVSSRMVLSWWILTLSITRTLHS